MSTRKILVKCGGGVDEISTEIEKIHAEIDKGFRLAEIRRKW